MLDAARNGGAEAAANAAAGTTVRRGAMDLEEAIKILNVEKGTAYEEVLKKYDHLFKANEQSQGSFYLQSKVVRAKERLEQEYPVDLRKVAEEEFAKKNPPPPPPKDDAAAGAASNGAKSDK